MVRLAAPMKEIFNQEPDAGQIMDSLSCAFNVKERLITRKMQMSYGWDNVPRIITTGIYRRVKLKICKKARIDNVWFRTEFSDNYSRSKAKIAVEFIGTWDFNGEIEAILSREGVSYGKRSKVRSKTGIPTVSELIIDVPDPG